MHSRRTAVTQPLAGHFACLRILTCSHLVDKQLCVQPCMGTNQLAAAALARSLRAASGAFLDEGDGFFLIRQASPFTIMCTRWRWAQCKWCWRWEYNMSIPDGFNGPLCRRCMELEEPPWWPNHRQRCELFVWHCFGRGHIRRELPALARDMCRTIASFVSKPWLQ